MIEIKLENIITGSYSVVLYSSIQISLSGDDL